MKLIFTLFFFLLLFLSTALVAQDTIQNGGFEDWRLKEFKCCGRNIDVPYYWGIAEQLTGINYNKFIFRQLDSPYVHSGYCSMELFSDTTYFNDLELAPGIIGYGAMSDSASTAITIGPDVPTTGMPVNGNPLWISFYMDIVHPVIDTPYYFYVFTKWDSIEQTEDTLSYARIDLPDDSRHMNEWIQHTDTIHYTAPGTPDTVRILFFGGRFGNANLQGNATYLDDMSFYYLSTGLVSLNGTPVLQLYPNPASNIITIKTGQYQPGNQFQVYDATGKYIEAIPIVNYSTTLDVHKLEAGEYFYRLSGTNNTMLTRGTFTITR